ncbi:hypothetical protein DV704_04860 [Meiothermus sp. QL-1]|uniref:Rieske 2Fe-2S domain-containing protein n=1 Tax=Meiothermus sp. QL-1 TaxID=2058095 RepID=UPI000E0A5066|nr:Rieske 2Fe-2S domain-containing protein [Meiothermus sp. QL-1]RDI95617.1 hypothetical protein DV704_04860 [Meiothermus sp. QL-1]
MKRRLLLKGLLGLWAGPGAAQQPRVRVAAVSQFPEVGSYVNFSYLNRPATVIRVAKPPHITPQYLQAGPDVYLSGYLRECPHNGCEVRFHPSASTLLVCYCHGSLFRRADGRLEAGVAGEDLPGLRLELEGEDVVVVGLANPA